MGSEGLCPGAWVRRALTSSRSSQAGSAAGHSDEDLRLRALEDRGYAAEDLRKIAQGNWVRVLAETWGA